MKLTLIGLVFFALFIASCQKSQNSSKDTTQESKGNIQNSKESSGQKEKSIWVCPMHPNVKSAEPGRCPICGMNLVKNLPETHESQSHDPEKKQVSESLPEQHSVVHLSPLRQQMIGVKWATVQKKLFYKTVVTSGKVAFDPELYTAQNELIEALTQRERVSESPLGDVKKSAQNMVESAKLRLRVLGLSDAQIENLAVSRGESSNLLVPKAGETLWVYAEVFEMDLNLLHPGLEATLSGGSLLEKEIKGKVVSVDRVINSMTRTARARILVPNAKALLRPEAYVDVTIKSPLGEQVVVPFDCVFDTGRESWVFVKGEGEEIVPKKIWIKYRSDDEVAVESGLLEGQQIVSSAQFLVDSESRLRFGK